MSTQRRGVALMPMETRYDIILRTAQLADELGYEAFALPEGWGLDATLLLTEAASRTRRIKLVSGILSVWGRTPGTLAMTAATLHRLSGGRFVLGLGPSTRALVEGFHDVRFVHPADKLRETTLKVRALLAGERALLDATPGSRPLPPRPAGRARPAHLARGDGRPHRPGRRASRRWFPLFVARDQVLDRVHTLRKDREAAALRTEPLTVVAGSRPSPPMTPPWLAASRPVASPGICPPWATSTPGSSPSRDTVARSRSSSKRTRIPVPMAALSPPRRRSSWTSSPPTVRQARSAISWRGGAARSTWR
jgi:alkanesulfonate monooxygenase SsuD/methylene tetrahydromethanopterin reductase-like flavin-dependent oxidoreductase (luciferase family)